MADSEQFEAGVFRGEVMAELKAIGARLGSIEERMVRYIVKVQRLERIIWIVGGAVGMLAITRKEIFQALSGVLLK